MSPAILSLAAAGFAVVTTEFVIIGILPQLARDLSVSIAQAGLLATIFAFTVALAGPFLTAMTARVERKTLFVSILGVFTLANALSAIAPNFTMLAASRVLAALALPVFWSVGSATAAQIVGPERSGRAVAMLFASISAAIVLGIPLGTLLADAFGWRVMFAIIAALSGLMTLALALFFPRTTPEDAGSLFKQAAILKRGDMLGHLAVSGVAFTAMFTAYTYLADMLQSLGGYSAAMTGWILMGFGFVGVAGNWIAGRFVDRFTFGTSITSSLILSLGMAVSAPLIGMTTAFVGAFAVWGAAHSASFLANQVRVMKAAPEAQAFAAALNVSVCQLGIGLGAIIGGRTIEAFGVGSVGMVGAAIGIAAVAGAVALALAKTRAAKPTLVPIE
jgi:MFS transporter, DHA1 family, inner membrane transport protein